MLIDESASWTSLSQASKFPAATIEGILAVRPGSVNGVVFVRTGCAVNAICFGAVYAGEAPLSPLAESFWGSLHLRDNATQRRSKSGRYSCHIQQGNVARSSLDIPDVGSMYSR